MVTGGGVGVGVGGVYGNGGATSDVMGAGDRARFGLPSLLSPTPTAAAAAGAATRLSSSSSSASLSSSSSSIDGVLGIDTSGSGSGGFGGIDRDALLDTELDLDDIDVESALLLKDREGT